MGVFIFIFFIIFSKRKLLLEEPQRATSYINLGCCCNTLSTTLVALPLGSGASATAGHGEGERGNSNTADEPTARHVDRVNTVL